VAKREGAWSSETVLLALGCVVVGAWVIAVLVEAAFPSHVVPPEVHGIVFVVATSLFGGAAYANKKNGNNGGVNGKNGGNGNGS
jgi:hypothetical protein